MDKSALLKELWMTCRHYDGNAWVRFNDAKEAIEKAVALGTQTQHISDMQMRKRDLEKQRIEIMEEVRGRIDELSKSEIESLEGTYGYLANHEIDVIKVFSKKLKQSLNSQQHREDGEPTHPSQDDTAALGAHAGSTPAVADNQGKDGENASKAVFITNPSQPDQS